MSLFRRSNSPYWYISVVHNGKRKKFSTKLTDEVAARQLDLAIQARTRGLPKDRFVAIVESVLGDAPPSSGPSTLVSNLAGTWEKLIEDEGRRLAKGTMDLRRRTCRRFSKWCEEHYGASLFVEMVTPEIAWEFIAEQGGATSKTRRNTSGDLSSVWSCLIRRGLVKENPWHYARPRKDITEEKSGRAFTLEEVRALLREADAYPWMKPAVMVALYTGLRKGDVFALRWEDVDMERDVIHITPSKTERHGIKLTLPLHQTLKRFLECLPHVGLTIVGHVPKAHTLEWKAAVQKAIGKDTSGALMTFHNLRHTYATWVREAGADKGEVMKLCGHTNVDTSNRYDHAEGRLRDVVGRLPSV